MSRHIPSQQELWDIRDYLVPLSSKTQTIRVMHSCDNIAFRRAKIYCADNCIYSVIKTPGVDNAVYECMNYFRPLSKSSYQEIFCPVWSIGQNNDGLWNDPKVWKLFADQWGIRVHVHELRGFAPTADWKAHGILGSYTETDLGALRVTPIDPQQGDTRGEIDVLLHNGGCEPLENVFVSSYCII